MSRNTETQTNEIPPVTGDLLGSIEAVAVHVVTARAAKDLVLAAYERVLDVIPVTSRKAWGVVMRTVEAGWDNLQQMSSASGGIDALVWELVNLGKAVKPNIGGPLVLVVSALTLVGVAQHAVRRRMRELRNAAGAA
ncbi:MAG TPA: hypothetical protein VM487_07675 [Phycisphaerae bacterium]|nr:hypothetical protein [Phycisphaerae bacterium]